jgi:omega-hydroxy-beta-dihydromenaquinone-9 sulfotransferase
MIFHFDFANYFRMVRLAWGEQNPRARRVYLAKLLLWVPPVALFHAVCFLLDGVFFPGLHRTAIRKPVFVIGHARSGTTLVHRLLSEDGERFSSFRLYEMFFPSLLQKKAIRAIGAFDRDRLGGWIERRVLAYDEKVYGPYRAVHPTGIFQTEEDDQVLYYSMASGFWITKMPYMGDLDFYYLDRWPARRRRRLMRFYAACIRRQLYLNGGDRIHLSKNPVFPGRLETLLEAFPDAHVVVPMRNPYETIPSLLELMRSGWKALGWDPERQRRCLAILADQSFDTYLYPLRVLERHPEVPHAIVDYRDLVADPAAAIEQIYRALGLPLSPEYREVLLGEGKRAREHKSGHSYSLDKFGLDANAIRSGLAELFEQYGWDASGSPARSPEGEER